MVTRLMARSSHQSTPAAPGPRRRADPIDWRIESRPEPLQIFKGAESSQRQQKGQKIPNRPMNMPDEAKPKLAYHMISSKGAVAVVQQRAATSEQATPGRGLGVEEAL